MMRKIKALLRRCELSAARASRWHVRDWGRGLRYEHLTQNENKEKLAHPDQVVGKFGVGLKDALVPVRQLSRLNSVARRR